MAFGAILAFLYKASTSTQPILRHSPLHTSASALGGSYDNTLQKTRKRACFIKSLNLTGLLITRIYTLVCSNLPQQTAVR